MGKRAKNRRDKKKKHQGRGSLTSSLAQHKQIGKKLRPPLATMEQVSLSSWRDDHMPEMLWAVLITETLDRDAYLGCFRQLIRLCAEWFRKKGNEQGAEPVLSDGHVDYAYIVDHTKLAEISDDEFAKFIAIALRHPLGYAALRPLLLVESLPGRERWVEALAVEPKDEDWTTLADAVAAVLDHQSERSTDIRWFKLMVPSIAHRIHYPTHFEERVDELMQFPNKGDMRAVRPFIRAGEMNLRRYPPRPWIANFWTELQRKTRCIDPSEDEEYSITRTRLDGNSFYPTRLGVVDRFLDSMNAKRTDPKLDGSFGLVLYALAIVEEVGFHSTQRSITGRFALRAVVEANITLRYLIAKNSDDLWRSYRVYGAGQAKLAFLKAQENEGDLPGFIDKDSLESIANEDVWQEYLDIDIGHWSNSSLRQLATACGAKELYDRYYGWSSAFMHAHWGAVRDTNFITCHNPLHRLHRIPRHLHRMVNSVDADLVELVNDMLDRLDRLYPGSQPLSKMALRSEATSEPQEMNAGPRPQEERSKADQPDDTAT